MMPICTKKQVKIEKQNRTYEFNNIAYKCRIVNDKLKKISKLKKRILTIGLSAGRGAKNLSKICREN
jgi:hypothetical protein